ncbi:MAG: hypothetical protein ACAI34_00750 [Verrucomicrobium sp.]
MNRNTNTASPKKPSWWSPKSGLLLAAGFGIAAAWPFLSSATKLAAAGEEVSVDKVMKTTMEHEKMEPEKLREVKAYAVLSDGTAFLGTKGGLFVGKGGEWRYDAEFPGGDIKNLALAADGTLWAATKRGVFQRLATDGKWQLAQDKDAHSITLGSAGEVFITGKYGVMKRSGDGTWQTVLTEVPASAIPAELARKAADEKKNDKEKDKEHGHSKSEGKGGPSDG